MHNGQGGSSTESGAYTLLGGTPIPSNAINIVRSSVKWFLSSENEWYKAAYFNGTTGIYYDYATGTRYCPEQQSSFGRYR